MNFPILSSLILLPTIGALFLFFTKDVEIFKWITFEGLVITQLDTNLVSAIIGMYFGGSLVKR